MRLPVFLMEDGLVTDVQVRRLHEKRMSGKTLAAAAAAAGMSERTARRWQSGALPSTVKAPRRWRTREDPFADVWQSEVVPQLVADTEGRLQAQTLFTELWCARLTGEGQPVEVRRKEGVTNHFRPESCAGRCEAAGEALTGARTGRAIEHRKRERLERRDCHSGRRQHRHHRNGEGMAGSCARLTGEG